MKFILILFMVAYLAFSDAWVPKSHSTPKSITRNEIESTARFMPSIALTTIAVVAGGVKASVANDGKYEYQPALQGLDYGKPRTYYPDFTQVKGGLQYKVVKEGEGKIAKEGDRVSIDWEGYTIGYYGRPFQTRNKVKGGAFDSTDTEFFRFIVGQGSVVEAVDQAVRYLKEGSIAQVIVPAELGYPEKGDSEHLLVGPKPSTFSGQVHE